MKLGDRQKRFLGRAQQADMAYIATTAHRKTAISLERLRLVRCVFPVDSQDYAVVTEAGRQVDTTVYDVTVVASQGDVDKIPASELTGSLSGGKHATTDGTVADADRDFRFPVRPGDWVMAGSSVAQVRQVHLREGSVLADLVIYARNGNRIGRESPALGGPRTFEPMCQLDGWERCEKPSFPMQVQSVAQADGTCTMMYWSPRLPPADYRKPKPRMALRRTVEASDDAFRRALESIAAGHNDPRSLAAEVLGRQPK